MHIAEARIQSRLSYADLAARTGWSEYRIRAFCTGVKRPSPDERKALVVAVAKESGEVTFGTPPATVKNRKVRHGKPKAQVAIALDHPAELNGVHSPGPIAVSTRFVVVEVAKELPRGLVVVTICGIRFLARDLGEKVDPITPIDALV